MGSVRQVEVFKNRPRGGRGYYMVDNRASGGELEEYNTMTCAHCNSVVVLNPKRRRARGYCSKCHAYVCDDRLCAEFCSPITQCLELILIDPTIPALPRTPEGGLLFDPALLQKGRVF